MPNQKPEEIGKVAEKSYREFQEWKWI